MYDEFIVRNGWVGKESDREYYFFNLRDKEFAVFGSKEEFGSCSEEILTDILIEPKPDFLAKPHFAAMTLTTACNMNCPYCYVQPIDGKGTWYCCGMCCCSRP